MQDPIEYHKKTKGKFAVCSKVKLETKEDLSLAYTPGVAKVSSAVAKNPTLAYDLTSKSNTVAVVTDGTAVLGLGDIGPLGALPVMEGKAILFKEFGNVDAVPICLDTKDTEEIIKTVKLIAQAFGGINLEDISAPRCFEIEQRLINELDIPVFHDDQHGTAIVVLAGLINALKIVNKTFETIKVVINGAGAAGIAIANMLIRSGVKNLMLVDSKGITCTQRPDLNEYKRRIAKEVKMEFCGSLFDAMKSTDVFIGVSKANLVSKEMIRSMAKDPIIFAMANPVPEIMPDEAYKAGAAIVATGRSDFPNQVNNVLAFPGIFRGVLDIRAKKISYEMKIAAAKAIANMIKTPTRDMIIPSALDKNVAKAVADAVKSV